MREQLHTTVQRLRQLPRVIAPLQPAGITSNGNGNGNGAVQAPDGPAALLGLCRDLAMQVKVRGLLCLCLKDHARRLLTRHASEGCAGTWPCRSR